MSIWSRSADIGVQVSPRCDSGLLVQVFEAGRGRSAALNFLEHEPSGVVA